MCLNVELNEVNYFDYDFFWSVNLWSCGHVSIQKFPADTMRDIPRILVEQAV